MEFSSITVLHFFVIFSFSALCAHVPAFLQTITLLWIVWTILVDNQSVQLIGTTIRHLQRFCSVRPLQGFQPSFPLRSTRTSFGGVSDDKPDPSDLESGLPDDDERVECNLNELKLGNQTGLWSKEKDDIKWAYDNSLKGQEVQVWWPGRDRGCWYRAKLLNDPHCTDGQRCIHFAAHDGEPTNTYTCPTWIRDPDGIGCKLPVFSWQACPMRCLDAVSTVESMHGQSVEMLLNSRKDPNTGEPIEQPGAASDESSGEASKAANLAHSDMCSEISAVVANENDENSHHREKEVQEAMPKAIPEEDVEVESQEVSGSDAGKIR
eukprot:Skav205738  [mRNA]  locus=scaffold1496:216797:226965:+ [translate_table: standard]